MWEQFWNYVFLKEFCPTFTNEKRSGQFWQRIFRTFIFLKEVLFGLMLQIHTDCNRPQWDFSETLWCYLSYWRPKWTFSKNCIFCPRQHFHFLISKISKKVVKHSTNWVSILYYNIFSSSIFFGVLLGLFDDLSEIFFCYLVSNNCKS